MIKLNLCSKLKKTILADFKNNKYYLIIIDLTPDVNHINER